MAAAVVEKPWGLELPGCQGRFPELGQHLSADGRPNVLVGICELCGQSLPDHLTDEQRRQYAWLMREIPAREQMS
jgi:hypothetical protein